MSEGTFKFNHVFKLNPWNVCYKTGARYCSRLIFFIFHFD